jgi:uncharacterized protein YceH (UPF0502 family)
MATCNSCGGVIGRDCFNPEECAWIGHQQEQEQRRQQEHATMSLEQRVEELEQRIAALEERGGA